MSKLAKRLVGAAREARAIARGKADPKTFRVHVPTDTGAFSAEVDAGSAQKMRQNEKAMCTTSARDWGLSQEAFALRFGLPVGTVRDWEQRRRTPEGPARVLLTVIEKEPEAVRRALASSS